MDQHFDLIIALFDRIRDDGVMLVAMAVAIFYMEGASIMLASAKVTRTGLPIHS